jgi:CDP-paratose synthetase
MEISKITILITGINGFLGSNLAKKLSDSYNVIGLESPKSEFNCLKGNNLKIYYSNNPLDAIFKEQDIDYIVHTAAIFGRNNESISDIVENNLHFPIKLLEKAKQYGIKGFINTHTPLPRSVSSYSLSKGQFLDWILLFQNKMQLINIVPEHFYGPGASDTNFITDTIKKMLANVPSIDFTPGGQCRDFVYIDEMVDAYYLVLKNIDSLPLYSEFEIGTGKVYNLKEVVMTIQEHTKSSTILNFGVLPYRENELMQSKCNNTLIKLLGWKPEVTLNEGITRTVNFLNL